VIAAEDGRPYVGESYDYRYGRMETVRTGDDLVLAAAGNMLAIGLDAWHILADDGVRVALVNVSDWSDLHDEDLAMLGTFRDVVVLEDHNVKTGLGTAIGAALQEAGHQCRLTRLGVSRYAASGKPAELYRQLGLDAGSVGALIRRRLENDSAPKVGSRAAARE
jgi:transketolase